jgi:hypothetical protein
MKEAILQRIDEVVESGKLVVSGDSQMLVALAKLAILNDLTISFYVSRQQAKEIKEWYWTPERAELVGLLPISREEAAKIKELGVDDNEEVDSFRYCPIKCTCGHVYGAFDFFRQAKDEHGLEMINALFALKSATLFQVNPTFVRICPNCARALLQDCGGSYDSEKYGGCCCSPAKSRQKSTY